MDNWTVTDWGVFFGFAGTFLAGVIGAIVRAYIEIGKIRLAQANTHDMANSARVDAGRALTRSEVTQRNVDGLPDMASMITPDVHAQALAAQAEVLTRSTVTAASPGIVDGSVVVLGELVGVRDGGIPNTAMNPNL